MWGRATLLNSLSPASRLPALLPLLTFIDVDRSTDQPALGAAGSMVSGVQKNK